MAQKFDYPKSEGQLKELLENLYSESKNALENKELPRFKGLLEIISAEATILTAIHKIKANKGSDTPGSDGEKLREEFLHSNYDEVINRVQSCLINYSPILVRRVYIPKPGTDEKRPLGIPSVIDRIIQECVRMVIEPILEAQFFKHSYGFRPMRDTDMAIGRVTKQAHSTGYHWVLEGDISKFFDNVDHTLLLKKLWHLGIRDRRVLMIIKQMLKAGIMDEKSVNQLGTPQGGIISPLLANAYLNCLDQWIVREWEEKQTRHGYSDQDKKIRALKSTNLKPAYLVRYADDWVLITNSKSSAEKWKNRISRYLNTNLKLRLSDEKTVITDIRRKPIKFVGFEFKVVKGKSRTGWITRTRPNQERLKSKIKEIHDEIRSLRRLRVVGNQILKEQVVHKINLVNSKIRGLIQYYEIATWVNYDLNKYANILSFAAFKALKRYGGYWCKASEVNNLTSIHMNYDTQIPTIDYNGLKVGITNIKFCKRTNPTYKNQVETPYSKEGREAYFTRTTKKPVAVRADEILLLNQSKALSQRLSGPIYNFEYYLNRAYAFNRDKGKCRVCSEFLPSWDIETHHVSPKLPLTVVNRVMNLASVHKGCHEFIHSNQNLEHLGKKIWLKILDFREKVERTS
ncbi:group II intron reverse transcriptase/maturase [Paenibacillus sp. 2TAB26]|uniref:group II intron reverse transcriptase/maturase n=1 Tax=Paenibacillus sp. 2TAB26 TaxID=3233005 RepID=UPI003F9CF1AF